MKRTVAALLASCAFAAQAVIPENGWWWAANEPGRGFNIEVQDNQVFLGAFAYEPEGAPVWLVSGGTMTSDRDYSGPLFRFGGGQCFGCPFVSPTQVAAGTLALRFTSSQAAVVTINGQPIEIKRFDFWQNEVAPDAMLGEWSMVIGEQAFPLYDGERVQFGTRRANANGPYLDGARLGSAESVAVVAQANGSYGILVDSSPDYYRFFRYDTTGFNRLEGQFWIFEKSGNPSGAGTFFQGFRTASASFVQSGNGPASSKRLFTQAASPERFGERDADLARKIATRDETEAADPLLLQEVEVLKAALREVARR